MKIQNKGNLGLGNVNRSSPSHPLQWIFITESFLTLSPLFKGNSHEIKSPDFCLSVLHLKCPSYQLAKNPQKTTSKSKVNIISF